MKQAVSKPLPHDVTLGALLVVLLASAFLIVLPRLHALRALPQHYYNLLPVASQAGDVDRDGVPDNLDATPYGSRDTGIGAYAGPKKAEKMRAAATEEEATDAEAMEAMDAMEDVDAMEAMDAMEANDEAYELDQ